ncbi:MAG: hypothetical protein K2O03_12495 [Lachnospiraceae bacterium]|nr:hypothetical protein [Lachnospiraceae bacterium]
MLLPGQAAAATVKAENTNYSYSYDTIEIEWPDGKAEISDTDIPGSDLDGISMFLGEDAFISKAGARTSYASAEVEAVFNNKVEAGAREKSVKHPYRVEIKVSDTTIISITQTTQWTYARGISSTFVDRSIFYENLEFGYMVENGGSTKMTNNDGTQQYADYFRISAPDGTRSNWYRILSVCSVQGVVSSSITLLDY